MGQAGTKGPKVGRRLVSSGTEGKLQAKENGDNDSDTNFTTQGQKFRFFLRRRESHRGVESWTIAFSFEKDHLGFFM